MNLLKCQNFIKCLNSFNQNILGITQKQLNRFQNFSPISKIVFVTPSQSGVTKTIFYTSKNRELMILVDLNEIMGKLNYINKIESL